MVLELTEGEIEMNDLRAELETVAGRNVLNSDDKDIKNLAKACSYLSIQLGLLGAEINNKEHIEDIRQNAKAILRSSK